MTQGEDSGGERAESMVAVGQLEQVLDSRLTARAEADSRVTDAEREAERILDEGRERGRAAAEAIRRSALEAAEQDAAELTRQTEADVATLRARAARQRPEAVRAILAALLPDHP
jgi:vacuolar-type H+-ATPase subunit H